MENRRHVLKVLGAATLGGFAGCNGEEGVSEASGPIAAGQVSDYIIGTLRALPNHPVAVGRDEDGFYAMTTICTHQQCDMRKDGSVTSNGLSCSCHGSQFDRNGVVLPGSAARTSLRHYRVGISDGALTVFAGEDVPASTRIPPG
ncbi:MAG: Rieske (2Fe-2S) protein [Myxococcales bacterium]|nr:Rieske (2Fe-2S) protein [Polyangiaceae bacterium]MDW8251029.1 Rieske (2Fe-2S) protein [Myxococcales bacterium]